MLLNVDYPKNLLIPAVAGASMGSKIADALLKVLRPDDVKKLQLIESGHSRIFQSEFDLFFKSLQLGPQELSQYDPNKAGSKYARPLCEDR